MYLRIDILKEHECMKYNLKKKTASLLFASTIALGVALPTVASAQSYDELINDTQNAIDNLSAQQATLYNELAIGYQALETLQNEATELLTGISEDESAIADLAKQISELETLIAKREDLLADQARAVQANGGTSNYLTAVASSQSVSEFVGRLDVVRKMVSSNKDLLNTQKEDKEAVVAKQAELEKAKEDKIAKQVELEALKAGLQEQQVQNEAVYEALTNDISLAAANRDALIAEKQAFEEQQAIIAAQQAAAQQAAAEAAQAQAAAEAAQAEAIQAQEEAAQAQAAAEAAQVEADQLNQTGETVPEAEETPVSSEVNAEQVVETVDSEVADTPAEETQTSALPEVDESAAAQAQAAAAQAEAQAAEAKRLADEQAAKAQAAAEEAAANAAAAQERAVQAQANATTLLDNAAQLVGIPYVWGGKSTSGFDCSGFVQYVFKQTYGIDVGGWTVAQESAGTKISVGEAQAGDLYFWGSPGGTYHVAIATGNGNYIHASQPGTPLGYNNIQNFTPSFALRVNVN